MGWNSGAGGWKGSPGGALEWSALALTGMEPPMLTETEPSGEIGVWSLSLSKQGGLGVPSMRISQAKEGGGTKPTGVALLLISGSEAQHVVPVFAGRAESVNGGVKLDHGLGHRFAGVIAIKAAEELALLTDQLCQPGWVGPGPGGGEAAILRVQSVATDRIDGRLTEDRGGRSSKQCRRWDGEEALVLARSRGHPAPGHGCGAAQFRAHGLIELAAQDKDGVSPGVGVKAVAVDERFQQDRRQRTFLEQIAADHLQLLRAGRGKQQRRSW